MNVAAICIMTIAMLLMSAASLLADQDSIEILSVDAQDGAVLKTGTVVKVTIRYNLSSAERGQIDADVWFNQHSLGHWQVAHEVIKKGKGELTMSVTAREPCVSDSINVSIWSDPKVYYKESIAGRQNHITLRWIDPKFADVVPNAMYKGMEVIMSQTLPHSQKLYESLLGDGVSAVHWKPFGDGIPAVYWDSLSNVQMRIGSEVSFEAAQNILDMCLECTTNICLVRMAEKQKQPRFDSRFDSCAIYIGCLGTPDFQPMPLDTLKKLADPNTSESEFRKILLDWNYVQALDKDKKDREQFIKERHNLPGVNDASVSTALAKGVPPNGLVAYYTLANDTRDSLGLNDAMNTQNIKFESDGIFLNGLPHYDPPTGSHVGVSLKRLRYEQFTFSLNFKPIDFGKWKPERKEVRSAIVSGGVGDHRWMALHRSDNGNLELTLNDGEFRHEFDNAPLLTNEWNCVTFAFDLGNRKACFFLNGNRLPDVSLPEDFTLKVIGSEDHFLNKAIGFGNRTTDELFHGYLRNVLLYDIALPPEELSALHHAMAGKPQ